ncbi:hypothetical protein CT1703 [Chlorobaculum tepidum TLS]|uniref:Uncharacterized protein n=1 Tax=Chlorobaculum tepidum (strain ATCC 49652 / DSM 12025 / NBRC 103806 / TLS) TaxID=194439 RepID=Q8KBT0_CHLTE|nr:hypothetical protein CT1703 [Chlorobaculum tepidum TLS]
MQDGHRPGAGYPMRLIACGDGGDNVEFDSGIEFPGRGQAVKRKISDALKARHQRYAANEQQTAEPVEANERRCAVPLRLGDHERELAGCEVVQALRNDHQISRAGFDSFEVKRIQVSEA